MRSADKAAKFGGAMAKAEKQLGDRLVSKNRRAFYDYEIGDSYEAGLQLSGSEVRSLRVHGCDLSDAWVHIDGSEAWVKGMSIPPLQHAAFSHEEKRKRKLLLHREQIERLRGSIERDGMTLVATKCYFKNNHAKLEIALGKGKKKHDKRQSIREREMNREARVAIRRGR